MVLFGSHSDLFGDHSSLCLSISHHPAPVARQDAVDMMNDQWMDLSMVGCIADIPNRIFSLHP